MDAWQRYPEVLRGAAAAHCSRGSSLQFMVGWFIGGHGLSGEGMWWCAVWESGSGAVLDGVTALQAAGMSGFSASRLDVTVPSASTAYRHSGIALYRRRCIGAVAGAGIPRARPEAAAIRAAQWATSDRQAALLICLPVQQRLVHPQRLLQQWETVRRSARRAVLDRIVYDVCDGAHSLGELDFGALCRRYGLPAPSRQTVHQLRSGRVYLDVEWEDIGLVVEIDGGHHAAALNRLDDAFRQNEVTLTSGTVLHIPVLAFRMDEKSFMEQVVRAHVARA